MTRIAHRRSCITAFVAALLFVSVTKAAALRTVALSGQQVPGAEPGVTYHSFGAHYVFEFPDFFYRGPVINDAGRVAFRADLTGAGVSTANNQGIWSEGSGILTQVARVGGAAPGVPDGVTFARNPALELFEPVLNSAGQIAFYGGLSDGGVGVWSEGSGSLSMVARDGMQVAGAPAGVNHHFGVLRDFQPDLPYLNDAGQIAFWANLVGAGVDNTNDWGVWSEGTGSLGLVARAGNPAPGTPEGVNFDSFFFQSGFNDLGRTAFFAFVTGEGVDPSNDQGIWSEASGTLSMMARAGDPAADAPSGAYYRDFFWPVEINNVGHTAFAAWLTGEGIDETNDEAFWSDASGTLSLVARSGNPAPGTPAGVKFAQFSLAPNAILSLNNDGDLAFRGNLTGTGVTSNNSVGIWLEDSAELELVARTGDRPAGTATGVRFSSLSRPTLNDAGQVAFRADLAGSGVNVSNNLGIWATDPNGQLQLIVRKGTQLEVAPGDLRTVSDLGFVNDSGNSDGRPSAFNNSGQLVFWARFTNGTQGVFISNVVASLQLLPGDFNKDGTVDAADYTVWRNSLGTKFDLNFNGDETGASAGMVDQADYALWKSHFGESLGSGATGFASASAEPLTITIPEPGSSLLAAIAMGSILLQRRRRTVAASLVCVAAALCLTPDVVVQGSTINLDSNETTQPVFPEDEEANTNDRGLYVSGRVPTSVKGPLRGGTNINSLVGADAFYSRGYTGTNAAVANIEGGHIWSGHETLTHVKQITNHPAALNEFDRHATWVGGLIGGRQGGANPGAYQEGLAPGAQLYSGAFTVQWEGARYSLDFGPEVNSVKYDQYRRAFSTGMDESGRRADVINSSWGGHTGSNGGDDDSIALDGFANANPHTLSVIAAGNDGPGPEKIRSPAAGYNNLAVAALGANPPYNRPASFSSGGPNDYSDAVNGVKNQARQVVDIAAPGDNLAAPYYGGETGGNGITDNPAYNGTGPTGLPNGPLGGPDFYTRGLLSGTSLAAPTVAGGAALLYDAAYDVFADNSDARDARVMKAVLMNSADKTFGWNNGQVSHPNGNGGVLTTQGLDNRVGTGRLNLTSAYDQFLTGTTDIAGTTSGSLGLVSEHGWDFGQVASGTTNDYFFASPLDAGTMLTATLSWFRDRRISDSNAISDDSFDDLNLELWSVADAEPVSLISESSSLYNESEHFSFLLPSTGEYALRVRWFKEVFDRFADANEELYGLAWSTAVAFPSFAVPEPSLSFMLCACLANWLAFARRRLPAAESSFRFCR